MNERIDTIFDRLRSQSGVLAKFSNEQLLEIIEKAHGECYLCRDPLDYEKDSIDGDHIDPDVGVRPENICLTHKKCNQKKRDLPIALARRYFELLRFSTKYSPLPSFDNALDNYVSDNRKIIKYTPYEEDGVNYLKINFGEGLIINTPVYVDIASKIKYCFCEVPIKNLFNDIDVQPRKISYQHVWKMLVDFNIHPVHEPSSLRLITDLTTGTAKLMLCDGQHKALSQILLGRTTIPAKLYIDPDIRLIRTLIDTIQNRIKKLPLYPSIVMEKLSVIYESEWEQYRQDSKPPHTERGFINGFRSYQKKIVRNHLIEAVYSSILFGESDLKNHEILKYIESIKRRVGTDKVISMNLFKTTILKNFVYQKPCDFEVGTVADLRLKEVNNVRRFLDLFVSTFVEDSLGLPREKDNKLIRIFKSGSVRAWVTTLKSAINNRLGVIDVDKMNMPFLRNIPEACWDGIKSILQRLEQHPIWGDDNLDVESKLNENKLQTSKRLFSEYRIPLDPHYLLGPLTS